MKLYVSIMQESLWLIEAILHSQEGMLYGVRCGLD
jgi:hypothetical protein